MIEEIEKLVHRAESLSDPEARSVASGLLQAALEFHAAALERILEIAGKETVSRIAADDLAASLLLLHDLHPDDLETRVNRAIGKLQGMFLSLGVSLSLAGIEAGSVRLCFESNRTWPAAAVRDSVENAIFQAAPEIESVTIEGIKESVPAGFVPLSELTGMTLRMEGREKSQVRSLTLPAPSGRQGAGDADADREPISSQETREHKSCDLCSAAVSEQHQHLVDPQARRLLCACDACAILFSSGGETQYRRVPRDIRLLTDLRLSDQAWNSLAIPIGLAFIFFSSASGETLAVYPSPAGPTESPLDRESWEEIVQDNPELAKLSPDVEALLINRMNGAREYFWTPIDECYRLAGLVRKHWRGFSGGEEGWAHIREFFDGLKERSYAGSFV